MWSAPSTCAPLLLVRMSKQVQPSTSVELTPVHFCPACEYAQQVCVPYPDVVVCLCCCYADIEPTHFLFGRVDWETRGDPESMLAVLRAMRPLPSARKLRLAYFRTARADMGTSAQAWLKEAMVLGEERVGTDCRPSDGVELRDRQVAASTLRLHEECLDELLMLKCITDPLLDLFATLDTAQRMRGPPVLHDLFPNPFLPLTWNPEWFSSTVRTLAANMYDTRDFSAMPILADALQDAGCEDEQVLSHCRATKPHARGCWVVDAILGKT